MFWGATQTHFSPSRQPTAKMSLKRAQNIFMPANINSIAINITLEGIEKIKNTERNVNRRLNNDVSIYQLNGFCFPLNENAQQLTRNYAEILPFEFSKIIDEMNGDFDKAYL